MSHLFYGIIEIELDFKVILRPEKEAITKVPRITMRLGNIIKITRSYLR